MAIKQHLIRAKLAVTTVFLCAIMAAQLSASITTSDLFFTTFGGGTNVHRVSYTWDNVSTFTLSPPVGIGATNGADGITGNPQNSNLLIVGGQGPRINTINRTTGVASTFASPVSVFHLEVTDSTTIFGSGIPGTLARHTINADGTIGAGTAISLTSSPGASTTITQLIDTGGGGFYYTSSGFAGTGTFGTLAFDTGNAQTATSATLIPLLTSLPAAHGGVYDPLTNSIILGGATDITQVDLTGNILATITFAGLQFDQGTVDGAGHLFWSDNRGSLLFLEYGGNGAASRIDDTGTFSSVQFLADQLDDIAPLVGSGSTNAMGGSIPEPASCFIWGGLLGAMGLYRRHT